VEPTLTVAIVDDHALVRDGLASTCRQHPGVAIVYEGDSLTDLAALTPAPGLVLLDLDLAGITVTGDDAVAIRERGSAILVVSALASPETVGAMLRAGVVGFVSKRETVQSLHEAIDAVLAGLPWTSTDLAAMLARDPERPQLSEQEQRALVLYASGLKIQSVARQMAVKPTTAKEYIERVRAKYAAVGRPAPTKIHLHAVAKEDGLLEP
jgi:DNA-binding NarL/FixJ family response regulator